MIFVCFVEVYAGCKEYQMCVRLMQNRVKLFSTAATLFVWRLRLRLQKALSSVADTRCTKGESSFPQQTFGVCIRFWAFRWQRHSETTAQYQYYVALMRASFFWCSNAVKMHFFVPSVGPCMNYNSGRHASTDFVWPVTLFAGLYTTCRGDRVLVVIRFSVTFPPLRSYWKKRVGLPVSWTIQEVQQCMVARFDAVRLFIPVFVRSL